jgi:hypothetical protein
LAWLLEKKQISDSMTTCACSPKHGIWTCPFCRRKEDRIYLVKQKLEVVSGDDEKYRSVRDFSEEGRLVLATRKRAVASEVSYKLTFDYGVSAYTIYEEMPAEELNEVKCPY